MDWVPLMTSSTIIPLENFWSSVFVYHDRPNLVNRKLVGASVVIFCKISLKKDKKLSEIFTREALLYEIRKLKDFRKITPDFIKKIDKDVTLEECDKSTFGDTFGGQFVSLRILFSRKNYNCLEIVTFDKDSKTATFFAIQEENTESVAPRFAYRIHLTPNSNLQIILNSFEDADTPSAEWLADKLFPKLLSFTEKNNDDKAIKSLSLVSQDKYHTVYADLKSKYSEDLVKNWPQKAQTDPQKYVFEDIAIATYLICLWDKLGAQKINFVDCGCGNGLLVYILNQEGYRGCGLDIRRRQVWDLYGNKADLRIGTITPESCFEEATWLIGNHSDELTPWLPIITRKSPNCNFFILPCCSYELNGQKYVRMNTGRSQYEDYLDYIKNISEICGFRVSTDKLRIPSTKRICLVGVQDQFNRKRTEKEISNFISQRMNSNFVPRDTIEKVRNCTHLNKDLINRIIRLVVNELLTMEKLIGEVWNQGGTVPLGVLIQKLSFEDRQSLKNECGGFQTLLKNHRYIFDVRNGTVTLRPPLSLSETTKYKNKPCWFNINHPNGCFYKPETCAYKH